MLVSIKYYHTAKTNLLDRSFEDYYFRTVQRLSMLATLMNFVLIIMCFLAFAFGFYWLLFILVFYNKNRLNISKTTYSQYDCTFFWLPYKHAMKFL